ncbi:hypothetical protein EV359DRAFT_87687 [Lentinula novae-zelandiae]|nr:hypothetical protein EV359DRAFT_87687 [Lentinula novae-zelandiae]
MSTSHTLTNTINTSSTVGPSRSRPVPPPPADSSVHEEEDLEDEDEDNIIRRAQERVERIRVRKAAEVARKAAEENAARAAAARERAAQEVRERACQAQQQEEEVSERRRLLAAAATARSQRGTSPSEVSVSPRRPMVKISKSKGKGKGKAKAQPVDEDPDDGDDDDEKEPCERCRTKKISCQMQAEGGSNPTGERLAVLESQVAQLLADNRQLRDGQVKANTYHCYFN